jgi:C-terminal processing protease CtpA/Prc
MSGDEVRVVVEQVIALVEQRYLDPAAAATISGVLAAGLADGRYGSDALSLADAVTVDLQSVNGDKHLRLIYHAEPLAEREPDDDAEEYLEMARWASATGSGVARVERMAGNVGYVDIAPVLFPVAICGDAVTAAMTLIASAEALIIDVRRCLGGDPAMVAWLASYLFDHEPVQLSGLQERDQITQSWTLPFVPGRRFGATKPVYLLTSSTTFSGGEQLSYDLQQLGRATIVGEVTRGGGHAREGFRVHPHLEATISVAAGVNPITGGNWEGTGVTPDVVVPAEQARERAHQLALEHVATAAGPSAAEATAALAALGR